MDGEYSELERNLHYADRLAGRIQFLTPADGTVSFLAIPPSLKRRCLVLFAPFNAVITYSNDPNVVLHNGITLGTTFPSIVLRLEDVGDCLRKPWYAIAGGSTVTASWIDVQEPTHCYATTPRTQGVLTPWQGHS